MCVRNNGLRQAIPVELPMYKFYIQGDKVPKAPMHQTLLDMSQIDAKTHDAKVKRRANILEKVVFARRNNFLQQERIAVANQKLELNVHR